jgi:hypothetical protein
MLARWSLLPEVSEQRLVYQKMRPFSTDAGKMGVKSFFRPATRKAMADSAGETRIHYCDAAGHASGQGEPLLRQKTETVLAPWPPVRVRLSPAEQNTAAIACVTRKR